MESKDWLEKIPEEYRKYARQFAVMKCEEQRVLCDQYVSSNWRDIENATTNCTDAPLPDMD